MPPQTSFLEGARSARHVRVILVGQLEPDTLGEDPSFELHHCEDTSRIARFLEGADASVLVVDLKSLSESERSRLRKQIAQFTTVLVLAISDILDDQECESLLRMGCVGSLQRQEVAVHLNRALKAIVGGELWFPRATLSRVLRGFLVAQDPDRLTSREREILALVGCDLNNQQIGDKLFISRETVRWHIKSLHAKLGIRTRRGMREHVRLLNRLGSAIPPQSDTKPDIHSRVAS
jgi:DNA-binding NarL/FixJ family response regulator